MKHFLVWLCLATSAFMYQAATGQIWEDALERSYSMGLAVLVCALLFGES